MKADTNPPRWAEPIRVLHGGVCYVHRLRSQFQLQRFRFLSGLRFQTVLRTQPHTAVEQSTPVDRFQMPLVTRHSKELDPSAAAIYKMWLG